MSPVFCAAGQLACEIENFCRSEGPVAALLGEILEKPVNLEITNDFSVMPLAADCQTTLVSTEPPTVIEDKTKLGERKYRGRSWKSSGRWQRG